MVNSSHCLHSWGTLDGPLQCMERGEEADIERGRLDGWYRQRNAVKAFRAGYKLQKKRTSECRGNKSRKLIINDKSPALATKQR